MKIIIDPSKYSDIELPFQTINEIKVFPIFINFFKFESIEVIEDSDTKSISNTLLIKLLYNIVKKIGESLEGNYYSEDMSKKRRKANEKSNKTTRRMVWAM